MKIKDSIYIVKGKTKSALINLGTQELRSISNVQLAQLGDDIDLEENLVDYIAPEISAYQKEILDIRISKECDLKRDFSFLNDCIKNGTAYMNVRIICPEESEVSIDCIKALIDWINETIYHFGLVIFISEQYNEEAFCNYFSTYRVVSKKTVDGSKSTYEPLFRSSPQSIFISQNNNLYHYSRDTITINGDEVVFTDHEQFNIPKSKIENCKDCEFRLTCFDVRKIRQTDGKYHYDTTCKYEL